MKYLTGSLWGSIAFTEEDIIIDIKGENVVQLPPPTLSKKNKKKFTDQIVSDSYNKHTSEHTFPIRVHLWFSFDLWNFSVILHVDWFGRC